MRQPEPFYRKQNQAWYVQVGKKQRFLERDENYVKGKSPPESVKQKYRDLMAGRQDVVGDGTGLQVIELLRRFLEWTKKNKEGSTHTFYKRHVLSFAADVGDSLTVQKLKPFHVTKWMDECYPKKKDGKGAGDNYRRSAIRSIQRAFNWAKEEGYIEANVLAGYKKPAYTPRDAILTQEQWDQLATALENRKGSGPAFLDFITLMRQTGCRPQEARRAEARHFDAKNRCLVFERKESKGHGGSTTVERRVVPLSDTAFALCQRLALKNPTGPLLRNSHGTAWKSYAIKEWFKRIDGTGKKEGSRSKQRIPFRTSAYVIRHTWATEALERGVDAVTVATIMGHKDVTMLMKVYQHLKKKQEFLRDSLHKALGLGAKLPVAVPA